MAAPVRYDLLFYKRTAFRSFPVMSKNIIAGSLNLMQTFDIVMFAKRLDGLYETAPAKRLTVQPPDDTGVVK
jgi:hypothetical protein